MPPKNRDLFFRTGNCKKNRLSDLINSIRQLAISPSENLPGMGEFFAEYHLELPEIQP